MKESEHLIRRRLSTTKYLKSPFLLSLKTLSGKEQQDFGNVTWENLLSNKTPTVFSKSDVVDLDISTEGICEGFQENAGARRNFTLLMLFLLSR